MSVDSILQLGPHFLAAANLHYRARNEWRQRNPHEIGGWLCAHPDAPRRVVCVTGPGRDAEFTENTVALCRRDIDDAAAAAGLIVSGNWHVHFNADTEPSDTDRETWRFELARSEVDHWSGVILARDDGLWTGLEAWLTFRHTGDCCRIPTTNVLTEEARARAHRNAWGLARGPLARSPHTWQSGELQLELDRLEVENETEERMRRGAIGSPRTERRAPVAARTSEPAVGAVELPATGLIRRENIGRILGVR